MAEPNENIEEDIGPLPRFSHASKNKNENYPIDSVSEQLASPAVKKQKSFASSVVNFDLEQLPNSKRYEKSYLHKDVINLIAVTPNTDFIITASVDGYVKFWIKTEKGIEFAKAFKAHSGPVGRLAITSDGASLATIAVPDVSERCIKLYNIVHLDMFQMIPTEITPLGLTWGSFRELNSTLLVLSSIENFDIYILNPSTGSHISTVSFSSLHSSSIILLEYIPDFDAILSTDLQHGVSFWSLDSNYNLHIPAKCKFSTKSQTDLTVFEKKQTHPLSFSFSPNGSMFAIIDTKRQIRVFNSSTCRVIHQFDESLQSSTQLWDIAMKKKDSPSPKMVPFQLDDTEFNKRLCLEKDLDKQTLLALATSNFSLLNTLRTNCLFNNTGTILLIPSIFGIKLIHLDSRSLLTVIGYEDGNTRFCSISLFQGTCSKYCRTNSIKKITPSVNMIASENPALKDMFLAPDPILFVTSFKKSRFYLFTRRMPLKLSERDVMNEKIIKEGPNVTKQSSIAEDEYLGNVSLETAQYKKVALMYTNFGEFQLELFQKEAPKAVENFIYLSRKGYYDNIIFHRVIKGFMIQTGDPTGDGTGGTSKWNREFEDEISSDLTHSKPYMVSMANSGPNTNGSQFFITTVACPWLDGKHTIFGKCISGMDTIHRIEKTPVNKYHRPINEVRVINIDIKTIPI